MMNPARRPANQIEKVIKYVFCDWCHLRQVTFGMSANAVFARCRASGNDIGLIGRQFQPAFDEQCIDLKVKLKPVSVFTVAERLVRAYLACCQQLCTLRKLKRVAVPLKNFVQTTEWCHYGIELAHFGCFYRVPANLTLTVVFNLPTQGMRKKLRPEANPQNRFACGHGLTDRPNLSFKMRIPLAIFDIHRPTQNDQTTILLGIRHRVRLVMKIDESYSMPSRAQQRIQRSKRLRCHMLKNHYSGHVDGSVFEITYLSSNRSLIF